jgi:hypothetical protein
MHPSHAFENPEKLMVKGRISPECSFADFSWM